MDEASERGRSNDRSVDTRSSSSSPHSRHRQCPRMIVERLFLLLAGKPFLQREAIHEVGEEPGLTRDG